MKISVMMVKYYFSYLMVGWFGDYDVLFEEGVEIVLIVCNIQVLVNGVGDFVWLCIGLEVLLMDLQVLLMEFDGGQYLFSCVGLLEVLKMFWE